MSRQRQPLFDRGRVHMESLAERTHKKHIERDHVSPDATPAELPAESRAVIADYAARIRAARAG